MIDVSHALLVLPVGNTHMELYAQQVDDFPLLLGL